MRILLIPALALSLCGCASGSLSLDPTDAHLAVGALVGAYNLGCVAFGNTDFCNKQDQKLAKKAAKAANGAIDSLPPTQ
jgi:hypothetical protein